MNVAGALTNLGSAHADLGDAARAKELHERALAIQEAAYGADHVNVAPTLGNLGIAYQELGDAARAKELYERALAIQEAAGGPRGGGHHAEQPWQRAGRRERPHGRE